ncbi:IclR family transcriptional regulator [Ferrovibrio sp.]|uniref:IclR family transcriptional regulator n=1 Tax=Ferrovibrio sp. TaxID=1917215 RepID=UPI0035B07EE3|nr:IclR family transcriptional regulator [Ferrovibrio sp.]
MSTLANATAILRLFAPNRLEVSVTDASRILGMPKSSASRLMKAMMEEGLLSRMENSPRYKVGNLLFEISRLYRLNSSLIEVSDQALKAIGQDTGHTGYISILDGSDVLVIRAHQGSHPLRVFTPLGQRAPAFATAIGRALLARLSDERVRELYPEGITPPSANAPQTMDELLSALADVRRNGWAQAVDEAIVGVGTIAVSVSDSEAGETIGFCLSFPASTISEAEKQRITSLLVSSARRIASGFNDKFFAHLIHAVGDAETAAA